MEECKYNELTYTMGELKIEKALYCLICDSEVQINESYSIFYTFITNSGILLANSLEKNLSLKDIGSLSLRSNLLCLKCFDYFEQLTNCESKIIKLKGDLWTVYKETCEKHGEKVETHIKGVSTQTDFYSFDCECKGKKNSNFIQENDSDHKKGLSDVFDSGSVLIKSEKTGEEITVDVDPHVAEDDSSKWRKRPESCKLCGKWFKQVSELDNHMVYHMEMDKEKGEGSKMRKKYHSCSVCSKKFRRPCEVKEHMVSHKSATPFICKYCGKNLKSKTGAIYHTLKTHKIDIGNNKKLDEHFHLDVKNRELENEEDLGDMKERGSKQSDEGKEDRENEGNSSSSEDELPLARRRKEFIFEKFKKDMDPSSNQKKKQKSMHNKEAFQVLKKWSEVSITKVPKSSEEESKKKFTSNKIKQEDELMAVVDKIGNEEVRTLISDLSKTNKVTIQTKSEQTSTEAEENQKSESTGPNEKTKIRQKKYHLSPLLKLKRQKDGGLFPPPMKEPKFKCDICEKMWKTRGELNAHKTTHSDARPYICEICGQAYKHKAALDVHVGMHRGIYHHQCPYCQKAFTQKGALQRHLPIHTGDLPYQCELCGKRFVHHTSFSMHSLAHSGVRKVKCEICGVGLLSKSHLKRHKKAHTGEKPFACSVCGKSFAERYNLVAHQRIHDPNLVGPARQQKKKLQTCRLCNATFDRCHKLEDHMVAFHNKVVEENPRPALFESGDGYIAPRFMIDRFDVRKPNEREFPEEKPTAASDSNPNDLSVRNLQNLHNSHLRNLELLRNLESNRNFELIRMANGIGSIEDTLRIPGAGSGTPWTYVNPSS